MKRAVVRTCLHVALADSERSGAEGHVSQEQRSGIQVGGIRWSRVVHRHRERQGGALHDAEGSQSGLKVQELPVRAPEVVEAPGAPEVDRDRRCGRERGRRREDDQCKGEATHDATP